MGIIRPRRDAHNVTRDFKAIDQTPFSEAKMLTTTPNHQSQAIATKKITVPNSFAFTSPYTGCWLEHFYSRGAEHLFQEKVETEQQFRDLLKRADAQPELMILGNFIAEREAIQSLCRELGIETVCSEDGFFPHYEAIHADPLGFAWESSLCRMVFRELTDQQRRVANTKRREWLSFRRTNLPADIRRPFVLWPLQLIGDCVNRWDLDLSDWSDLIVHFRESLPAEYQLAIKPHPRAKEMDQPKRRVSELPNTIMLPVNCDLKSLLEQASAVAGANSTVLMEARLMFQKPVYCYARSWFTNHADLFTPVHMRFPPHRLNRQDYLIQSALLGNQRLLDYTDWFLCQLLSRQLEFAIADDWNRLREWTWKRTYGAYLKYGEEIFL